MPKGPDYERETCTSLSLWWTDDRRDDVFWRASQSGGRAKLRGRKGKDTYGSHGDISAVDPIGSPLTELFTIEIKRGYNAHTLYEILDRPDGSAQQEWEKWFQQILESVEISKTWAWLLITKRDRREPMIYFPTRFIEKLVLFRDIEIRPYVGCMINTRFFQKVKDKMVHTDTKRIRVSGMRFNAWLKDITPEDIKYVLRHVNTVTCA